MKSTLTSLAIVATVVAGCGVTTSISSGAPTPVIVYVTPAPTGEAAQSSASAPATAASSAPVATPTPTPAGPMTIAYAAKVYLAVATSSNKVNDTASKKLPNYPTLAQWHSYFATIAADSRDFADRLRSRIWPAAAAADMKLLLRGIAMEGLYELQLSKVKTTAEFNPLYATWNDKITLDTSSLANAVRTDLGLPPVPIE